MSGMGNGRHLAAGTPEPSPPAKDVLRVYGMKFCPYVQKLKLVLAAKKIEHETVNINLKQKPDWFLAKTPLAKVPCVEKNGQLLYESDITSNYVDEIYPGRKLTTDCPLRKAKEMMLLQQLNLAAGTFYGMMFGLSTTPRDEVLATLAKGLQCLEDYLKETGYQFIGKDEPGMTDYMVWPHFERISIYPQDVDLNKHPLVAAYVIRMSKDDAVIACRHSNELLCQFTKSFKEKEPVYDIGNVVEYVK